MRVPLLMRHFEMPHRTSSAAAGPASTIYNVMEYCCVSLAEASSLQAHVLLPHSNMDGVGGQGFYLGKKQQIHQFFPEPFASECLLDLERPVEVPQRRF